MIMTPTHYWLIAAVVFMALEAFGVSGIGFLFVGLGALIVGVALPMGILADDQIIAQFALAFAGAVATALLLWKPIQKLFPHNHNNIGYDDLIGSSGIVAAGGLVKGTEGNVLWSGTIMKAELAADAAVSSLPEGARVTIVKAKGAKLTVIPKP